MGDSCVCGRCSGSRARLASILLIIAAVAVEIGGALLLYLYALPDYANILAAIGAVHAAALLFTGAL